MAVYSVLVGPVEHDGKRYEEGSQITLAADVAKLMASQGVISEAEPPKRKRAEGDGCDIR